MTTIYDSKTSAQFIQANQAEIAKILDAPDSDRSIAEIWLKHLLADAYTAGFDAGIDKARQVANEA